MSLKHGILGLLTYNSMTGYTVKKTFDKTISYLWTASLSQIYRELTALEKKGFISSTIFHQEDKPDKKVYTITDEGRNEFMQWLTDFPENLSSTKRDAFMLRIFFGSRLEKKDLIEQFERFIEQKRTFIQLLGDLSKKEGHKSNDPAVTETDLLYWRFTIKRAVMTLKTLIVWAEECIDELKS